MRQQQGGTLLAFILGLIVALAVALVAAVYVAKFPIPLMAKPQNRTPAPNPHQAKINKK